MVSYRDTRDKGGKVVYNLLLLGLGITLPYMEAGLSMELGELVVVRVSYTCFLCQEVIGLIMSLSFGLLGQRWKWSVIRRTFR